MRGSSIRRIGRSTEKECWKVQHYPLHLLRTPCTSASPSPIPLLTPHTFPTPHTRAFLAAACAYIISHIDGKSENLHQVAQVSGFDEGSIKADYGASYLEIAVCRIGVSVRDVVAARTAVTWPSSEEKSVQAEEREDDICGQEL